jgi:hypothetical protein
MQEIQGFFGMDAPVCAPMRRQRHLLLTGWSMVRIRPGEPNKRSEKPAKAPGQQIAKFEDRAPSATQEGVAGDADPQAW